MENHKVKMVFFSIPMEHLKEVMSLRGSYRAMASMLMRGECSYMKENGKIIYPMAKGSKLLGTDRIMKGHFKMVRNMILTPSIDSRMAKYMKDLFKMGIWMGKANYIFQGEKESMLDNSRRI